MVVRIWYNHFYSLVLQMELYFDTTLPIKDLRIRAEKAGGQRTPDSETNICQLEISC